MNSKALGKIDEIRQRIKDHPEYSCCVQRRAMESLLDEANKHSFNLELESGGDTTTFRRKDDVSVASWKNLKEARNYLQRFGLNTTSFAVLGKLIDPENNPEGFFRQGEVVFGPHSGVQPERLPYHVKNLSDFLDNPGVHPVEAATEAHIQLVRIHPYRDGNGRAARLVQNFYLEQQGYTPCIITPDERDLYISFMERIVSDRNEGKSEVFSQSNAESYFRDFVNSKVLTNFKNLESELKEKRNYSISLSGNVNQGIIYSLKHALSGVHSTHNGHRPLQARICGSGKNYSLEVTGNLSRDELDAFVKHFSRKNSFKYSIDVKSCC